MFEGFKELMDNVHKLPDKERQTALVVWCITESIYYVVIGLVVWSLGKRIINVATNAYKEGRRDAS
jgi:hypothetical protein